MSNLSRSRAFPTTPERPAARRTSPPLLGARSTQRPSTSKQLFDERNTLKIAKNALTREVRAATILREINEGTFYCAQWLGMGFHSQLNAEARYSNQSDAALNAQFVEQARALNLTTQQIMLRQSTKRAVSLATAHNEEHSFNEQQFEKQRQALGNFQHYLREAAALPTSDEHPLLNTFKVLEEPFIKS